MFGQVVPVTFKEYERAEHKPNGFRTLKQILWISQARRMAKEQPRVLT